MCPHAARACVALPSKALPICGCASNAEGSSGVGAQLLMNIPFTALYFASYESAKQALISHASGEESLLIQVFPPLYPLSAPSGLVRIPHTGVLSCPLCLFWPGQNPSYRCSPLSPLSAPLGLVRIPRLRCHGVCMSCSVPGALIRKHCLMTCSYHRAT